MKILIAALLWMLPHMALAQETATELEQIQQRINELRKVIDARIAREEKRNREVGLLKFTYVTRETENAGQADYFKTVSRQIEEAGAAHYPKKDGRSLYGKGLVAIPISAAGDIYEGDGGPEIDYSSGNAELDAALLAIVRRAAPFPPIPKELRTNGKLDIWIIGTGFNFMRESRDVIAPKKTNSRVKQ